MGDAPMFMYLLKDQLRRYLIKSHVVEEGHQVLAEVACRQPDLIILVALCADRAVPSGASICVALRGHPIGAAVPLIAILPSPETDTESAHAHSLLVQRSDDHLTLPVRPEVLARTIAPRLGLTSEETEWEVATKTPTRVLTTKSIERRLRSRSARGAHEPSGSRDESQSRAVAARRKEAEFRALRQECRSLRQQVAEQATSREQLLRCRWELSLAQKKVRALTFKLATEDQPSVVDPYDRRQLPLRFDEEQIITEEVERGDRKSLV